MLVAEWFKQYHRPHTSCDVEEFVMRHTQPEMKISVEKLLSYLGTTILKIDSLILIQKSVLFRVNRTV
jgi:methyl coenzyme M reductase subunit C-like uncharacterized protein (methanogenesis marker protein 7)